MTIPNSIWDWANAYQADTQALVELAEVLGPECDREDLITEISARREDMRVFLRVSNGVLRSRDWV